MNCTVSIMQPYLFPYIGYFGLVNEADKFVFYDDVNYITKGWVNRNQIIVNGLPFRFTLPLSNASRSSKINEIEINEYSRFKSDFMRTLEYAYKKSPYYDIGMEYVEEVLSIDTTLISEVAAYSVRVASRNIGLQAEFYSSGEEFCETRSYGRSDRLIQIIKILGSRRYINSVGGKSLYSKEYFLDKGVDIFFLEAHLQQYSQLGVSEYYPGMSIIDVFMNVDVQYMLEMVSSYELS